MVGRPVELSIKKVQRNIGEKILEINNLSSNK
jgi:hypothetical protein